MKNQKHRTHWRNATAYAGEPSLDQSPLVRMVVWALRGSLVVTLLSCIAMSAPGNAIRAQETAQAATNMVIVPSIERMTIPEARQKLQGLGLRLARFDAVSPDESTEIVTVQYPVTGRSVPSGSSVTVRVQARPQPPPQTQPTSTPVQASAPYTAQPEPAPPASASHGHKRRGNDNAVGGHKVIDDEVQVPEVLSDSVATARRKLDEAGLRSTVTRDPAAQHFLDQISNESPSAGEYVKRGTTVQLALQPGGLPLWEMILIAIAVFIAVGVLVARLGHLFSRWPKLFIVHASLSFGQSTCVLRGEPPRLACPPVNVRLTWSQQSEARVTRPPDSTRQRTY